jgi:histidinol-phosphatase (PHP family)
MQTFTLHTHNNELSFDGRASAREMVATAEQLGFLTIGVSNHLIVHPNIDLKIANGAMFFNDFNLAYDCYQKHIEILQTLKEHFKIEIKIGFETDFFQNKEWCIGFEKMVQKLNVDYLIGSNHFLKTADESFLCNIYHLHRLPQMPDKETMHELVVNHLKNIAASIESGYFSFIAHIDYCSIFGLAEDKEYDIYKYQIIDALKRYKRPFEINTSGYDRIGRPHPAPWMIAELAKTNDVPVLLSDDAHFPERLGQHFGEAEDLLKSLNYTNRFTLSQLHKPF